MNSIVPLLEELKQTGLVIRRDFPMMDQNQFLSFCRSAATPNDDPCLHWGFGPVMELKVEEASPNYLFSRQEVPFHWDGVFFEVPSVLIFQCLEAPSPEAGGETLFSDARRLYSTLSDEQRRSWAKARVTYRTQKLAHYGGEATFALFGQHPNTHSTVVRFAESVSTDKNPVTAEITGVSSQVAQEIVDYFTDALYHQDNCYTHTWQRGDLILADNHSLLHGRRAFLASSPRHIRRVQLR